MECEEEMNLLRRENGHKDKEIYFLREENIKVIKMLENYENRIQELEAFKKKNLDCVKIERDKIFEGIDEEDESLGYEELTEDERISNVIQESPISE